MLQQPNEYGVFLDAVALPRSHTRFRIQCPLWNKRRALDQRRTIQKRSEVVRSSTRCVRMYERVIFFKGICRSNVDKVTRRYDRLVLVLLCCTEGFAYVAHNPILSHKALSETRNTFFIDRLLVPHFFSWPLKNPFETRASEGLWIR